jgi:hypothetical protein
MEWAPGQYPAYGQGAKRDAVLEAVAADWAPFNATITDERPTHDNYVMNMTGPTNDYPNGSALGVAGLDCGNSWSTRDITFAFHGINDEYSASKTATTISQEVAHGFGLEHVDDPNDILNPYNAGEDPAFLDKCISIVPGSDGVRCAAQHEAKCGTSTKQNSYAELLAFLGPNAPDTAPPSVAITQPSDGAFFEEGADFRISAQASDDRGIAYLALYANGEELQRRDLAPYAWDVVKIPAGTYEFLIEAVDLAGNTNISDPISVMVRNTGGDGDTDDGGDGSTGSGYGETGDDHSDDDDENDDDPGAASSAITLPRGPQDCRCRTAEGRWGGCVAGLVLLLIGSRRRRCHVGAGQPRRPHPFSGRRAASKSRHGSRLRQRANSGTSRIL